MEILGHALKVIVCVIHLVKYECTSVCFKYGITKYNARHGNQILCTISRYKHVIKMKTK